MYTPSNMLSKSKDNQIYGKISDNSRQYYRNVYLQSEHWKNLRKEKLELNPRCEICKTTLSLDVHHKSYGNLYDVLVKDLQTLCRKCHELEHSKKDIKKNKPHIKNMERRNKKASDLRPHSYHRSSAKRRTNFNMRDLSNMLDRERNFNTYISIHY
jgi:hypothetical protein